MSVPEAMQDTVQAMLTMVGAEAATIERHPSATIVPGPSAGSSDQRAVDLMSRLARRSFGSNTGDSLALHGTIGEGGMGVVRLGTQHALDRPVAVKTLKDDLKDHEGSRVKLLREAWVTGRLEHPNVVPIYDIALDPDGHPQIVLKKIEGAEWGTLMHDADAVQAAHGASDLLEWNLRTLMQVCNAVHFAHSRGVLHRDLKPENVMIGSFGEVYLVDWGIAVSLEDEGDTWLPRARDAIEMAGTPMFMAPEMLGGRESRLSERTDVYLLGAILCEILSGDPPHGPGSFMEIIASIVDSSPALPEDAPPELTRLVRRAMDPDPEARFENAEQVRLAISGFLQHRAGAQLAAGAEARLTELEALLDETEANDGETEERGAIYEHFGECRFGLRHALEVWPDNAEARASLDRAVTRMIHYELAQGEPEAARALLGELSEAPPELTDRVTAERARRAAEEAELRRVSADQDPDAGRLTRVFVTALVGAMWIIAPLVTGLIVDAGWAEMSNARFMGWSFVFTCVLVGLGFWARESMMRTSINRQIGAAAILGMVAMGATTTVAFLQDRPTQEGPVEAILAFSVIAFMLAIGVDKRLVFSGIAYLAGFVWSALYGWSSYGIAACNLVLLINMSLLWARLDDLSVAGRRRARRARRGLE